MSDGGRVEGDGRGRSDVLADLTLHGSDLCRALSDWADGWLHQKGLRRRKKAPRRKDKPKSR